MCRRDAATKLTKKHKRFFDISVISMLEDSCEDAPKWIPNAMECVNTKMLIPSLNTQCKKRNERKLNRKVFVVTYLSFVLL